jgi:hypothetical protein
MKNLKPKSFALFIFAQFIVCFIGVAYLSNIQIDGMLSSLKVAYKTIPLLLFFWFLFSRYCWKWSIFQGWLVPTPYLEGTWKGTIQTTWKNPETGESPGPIPVILTIKQSFLHVSCVMRTAEMASRSYLADFWLNSENQIQKLGYSYTSVPSVSVAGRSQPHDGTVVFEIIGQPVEKLHGLYWTTRKTTGEISLKFHCRERLDEFPGDLGDHPMKGK